MRGKEGEKKELRGLNLVTFWLLEPLTEKRRADPSHFPFSCSFLSLSSCTAEIRNKQTLSFVCSVYQVALHEKHLKKVKSVENCLLISPLFENLMPLVHLRLFYWCIVSFYGVMVTVIEWLYRNRLETLSWFFCSSIHYYLHLLLILYTFFIWNTLCLGSCPNRSSCLFW